LAHRVSLDEPDVSLQRAFTISRSNAVGPINEYFLEISGPFRNLMRGATRTELEHQSLKVSGRRVHCHLSGFQVVAKTTLILGFWRSEFARPMKAA